MLPFQEEVDPFEEEDEKWLNIQREYDKGRTFFGDFRGPLGAFPHPSSCHAFLCRFQTKSGLGALNRVPREARTLSFFLDVLNWRRPCCENVVQKLLGLSELWSVGLATVTYSRWAYHVTGYAYPSG
jgi:hypothetical protein